MKLLSYFAERKQSMKRKLFGYMLALAVLLLVLLFAGLLLIGQFTGTKQKTYETLDFQAEVFEREILSHIDGMAVMGIQLSENTTKIIEQYLIDNNIAFSNLNGSEKNIAGIQNAVFDSLQHKLLETDCSGAFIVLDAQVNTAVDNAEYSKTGLYLQRNSLDSSDNHILLYRGLSDLGKSHGVMPHRKWRLEFRTDMFPNYNELINGAELPLRHAYRISDIFTLTGTSERAVLMTLPLIGSDGTVYGLCGFEISESYFKHIFAQPSKLEHIIFAINKGDSGMANAADCFSCGVAGGYYLSPKGEYQSNSFGHGLTLFEGKTNSYIGVTKTVQFCEGDCKFSLSVLVPKQDYNRWEGKSTTQIVLLLLLVVTATVSCCMYFSGKYLSPIKKGLDQIRQKEYSGRSSVSEIDDLFAFLAEQDRKSEALLAEMESQKAKMQTTLDQMSSEHSEAKQEIARLAYSRKNEVDPDAYEQFLLGIKSLTPMERTVFDYYLEGKSVKEIVELVGFKESTIRFHNRNIYSKLGVNSLKQLLMFAAIMKRDEEGGDKK